ncbi:MAG: hypothetical protein J6I45_10215, partial [Clostridia bacterium]|nr:hypothetical protein [Clostridia bacterium]
TSTQQENFNIKFICYCIYTTFTLYSRSLVPFFSPLFQERKKGTEKREERFSVQGFSTTAVVDQRRRQKFQQVETLDSASFSKSWAKQIVATE